MDIQILKRDMEIERGASKLRIGRAGAKLSIRGDFEGQDDLEIWSKTDGCEIKWVGHLQRADMNIEKGTYWVWNYCKLDKSDMIRLGKFLIQKARGER